MPLEIRVLGPLEVVVDGEPLRVDTRKAPAILALLAVEGRPYARDELAALFWPESDDESARGALRRTLSVLRAALGERWLRVDRATVALDGSTDVRVDLVALDAAAATGGRDGLARAAALARGPFLAGFSLRDSADFDDWRATRAVSVERRVVDVLERLASAAEADGDIQTAIDAANRLVDLDPLDEPARRRLMGLLARAGDRAGAIRLYRATVATLERELGVAPLAETTELYEAIRDERVGAGRAEATPVEAPASTTNGGTSSAARLPMVGRDEALAALLGARHAASPDGRVAVVRGEAGIGKSRLLEALSDGTRDTGGTALVARAFPAEATIAWAPVADLLRVGFALPDASSRLAAVSPIALAEVVRLAPLPSGVPAAAAADQAPDSPGAKTRLLNAVASTLVALTAGRTPGVIAVEDLQWADEASREALLFVARRLAGRAVLLVLSWRTEDLDAAGLSFASAVESMPGSIVVELGRLGADDVRELAAVASGPGLPAWDPALLAAESEGLPLYVVEALAAGPSPDDEPPRGVRALLRERLASVGETAGQVLAAAAVIGRSFDLDTVRAASGRSEDEAVDALEELVRRAIVREVGTAGHPVYDFGHARLRDAAYDEIGLARRRLLHRRVADVLRAAPGRHDAARLAQLAGHEQAAGRDAAAAEAYREAGRAARSVFAHREALGHLVAALALGHPDVVGVQVEIGEVRTALGDYAGAVAALEAAAAAADDEALAGIELRLGRVHARRGDVGRAASHLDAALDDTVASAERITVLIERAAVALRAGDLDVAARIADEARAETAALEDRRRPSAAVARLLGLVALARGDLATAAAELGESVVLADELSDDPGPAIAARNGLALVLGQAGRPADAIPLLEEALAAARRAGEPHLEAAVENNLADQLHAAGRTDESMAHLKRAVALFAEVGGSPGALEPGIWRLVSW